MSIPVPCSHVSIDGTLLEIYRCDADGGLVFNHQSLLRLHPGHQMKTPVIFRPGELEEVEKMWVELQKPGGLEQNG